LAQLLDAARARFEEEEDPLALQKLQEALQIEPDNSTALALKSKIENRRSEKQIEGWYRLARQHIDNHAYPHAREALQNVLQLRPREARALQLLADVDRQEQDYKKLRQEKEQIHRAAMDAWQKGDVSSALAKLGVVLELDRRAPDTMNRESGASYQSFYNEVRSEHDAMNTAYAETRKHLADRNFAKARALCQDYLAKYPTNAIFQALHYDIEEQQRQELSALIASVDRQVEAEPDLEKRVNILREALDAHPDELHFERALRLVQDKRDLVNSIVARAHLHEEQSAFGDALNDWEILRTIYSQYPGLKFEVERLQKRRDQQVRIEAKSKLIEQVDSCLHAADYARAFELLQSASAEYPNDTELQELEKLAQQGVQRKTEAQRLMTEGQDLFGQQKFSEGIQLLRQAYELDENNSLSRAVLANALVEQAHAIVETDWQEADKLSREAFELNPSHPMAKTLRTQILDQKRESFVSDCVSQARKLQASGDLAAALSRAEEGLATYPREPRLIQIQETVQRDLHAQKRQARRRDLEELRRMESDAASATATDARQTLAARTRELVEKYADDGELLSSANVVLQKLNLPQVSTPGTSADEGAVSATMTFAAPPTLDGAPAPSSAAKPSEPAAAPPVAPNAVRPSVTKTSTPAPDAKSSPQVASTQPKVAPAPPKKAPPQRAGSGKLIGIGAALVLLLIVWFFIRGHKQSTVAPPAAEQPQPQPVSTPPATAPAEPLLAALKLSSDTGSGKVSFDDSAATELQDAQWTLDKIASGSHTLKFDSPKGNASFSFSTDTGALPIVKTPIAAKGVLAVVVSSMGDRIHVYSSESTAKFMLNGQSPVAVATDGIDLPSVGVGAHELTLVQGTDQYKLPIEVESSPALAVFLESGQNVGTLVIISGQDKAKVTLNGKVLTQSTRNGRLRIPNLEPKDYTVRVSKDGFEDAAEQKIRIRKGEEARLVFNLLPMARMASLSIHGAAAGTTVFIDQIGAGSVQSDGSYSFSSVAPGDHVIELRKDKFKPRQIKKHFVAGSAVALVASDVALEAAPAELKITFAPSDAQVTLSKGSDPPIKLASGASTSLAAGTYTLSARATDNFTRTATLEVTAGQSRSLDLQLAPSGMSKWDDATSWKQEKGAYTRKGGDFVLYGVSPTSGTFIFSAMLTKGHRLQWMLQYSDANNYDLSQLDENNFYRTIIRNGQKTNELKFPHKSDKKSFHTIQIKVTPTEIVHQIKQGDAWVVLDRWAEPGANLSSGKFGFYLPGGDQVSLSSFSHYADLNLH
jgi:hypothetical protein